MLRLALAAGLADGGTALARAAAPALPTLTAGFVEDFEPFVMGDDGGILVELALEATRRAGYAMRKQSYPSLRLENQDAIQNIPGLDMLVGTPPPVYRDKYPHTRVFSFDNVAATLTGSGITLRSVEDLEGKSIITFFNASRHLKEPFQSFYKAKLARSKSYIEIEHVESIVTMLLKRRAQVALLDRSFLAYYARKQGHPDLQGITVHPLFPEKNDVFAISKQAPLIAAVRMHLARMEKEGWTAAMLKKYL